ncbi:hypothetical protein [Gloeobacter morelensis]|uniref:Peptidase M15 n=1 Tax=Gloeobacter morelensis MG652769 TaxID=2781736 RepID=A0ABY3PS09_9CYAN|nr:hypothetical protein [Gloeobacter morelensis]UFP96465.1 hypothetical protein ISF26_09735 [Gloeobacter morelensis MG652769]
MRKPQSVRSLEDLGRVRLSDNFFLRDFLYSEVANFYGVPNIPDDPELAIEAGRQLCRHLLEPLCQAFGRVSIRSAFRSESVNRLCNEKGHSCARNEANFARHIWDHRDQNGRIGAMACVVVHWYIERYEQTADFRPLAWWIHDHLGYSELVFFPKYCAFNIGWHEAPKQTIKSHIQAAKGCLTRPGMDNHGGGHSMWYAGFPTV